MYWVDTMNIYSEMKDKAEHIVASCKSVLHHRNYYEKYTHMNAHLRMLCWHSLIQVYGVSITCFKFEVKRSSSFRASKYLSIMCHTPTVHLVTLTFGRKNEVFLKISRPVLPQPLNGFVTEQRPIKCSKRPLSSDYMKKQFQLKKIFYGICLPQVSRTN